MTAGTIEQNYGRCQALALGVWNDLRLAVGIDVRDGAEGRPEVRFQLLFVE